MRYPHLFFNVLFLVFLNDLCLVSIPLLRSIRQPLRVTNQAAGGEAGCAPQLCSSLGCAQVTAAVTRAHSVAGEAVRLACGSETFPTPALNHCPEVAVHRRTKQPQSTG